MAIEQYSAVGVETKILDSADGIVEALVAVTGNEDSGADIITPGALKWDSKKPPKVLYAHDPTRVIGKTLEVEELLPGDSRLPADLISNGYGALRVKAQLNLDKQVARDALADLQFHNDDGFAWSIGYETRKKQYKGGVRHLNEIMVREYSALPFGMNEQTRTLSAKARLESIVNEAKELISEIETKTEPDTEPDTGTEVGEEPQADHAGTEGVPDANSTEVSDEPKDQTQDSFAQGMPAETPGQSPNRQDLDEPDTDADKAAENEVKARGDKIVSTSTISKLQRAADNLADMIGDLERGDDAPEPSNRRERRSAPNVETKGAIEEHTTDTSDAEWDGPQENERRLPTDADDATLREAYAWLDPDGDPTTKAAYRFIHHEIGTDGTVGAANLRACFAAIGVLNGEPGTTPIPDEDRQGVYDHLARHLKDAERPVPELKHSNTAVITPAETAEFEALMHTITID